MMSELTEINLDVAEPVEIPTQGELWQRMGRRVAASADTLDGSVRCLEVAERLLSVPTVTRVELAVARALVTSMLVTVAEERDRLAEASRAFALAYEPETGLPS